MKPFDRAIQAVGGPSALASKLGEKPQMINNWRKRRVPASRVLDVERVSGISRYELRPDIYGSARA